MSTIELMRVDFVLEALHARAELGGSSAASPGADVAGVGPDRAQMWQRVRAAAPMTARVRARVRGMLWHGTVGSACVTPVHVQPETCKRRAITACDMLPPLIAALSCSSNTWRCKRRATTCVIPRSAYHAGCIRARRRSRPYIPRHAVQRRSLA